MTSEDEIKKVTSSISNLVLNPKSFNFAEKLSPVTSTNKSPSSDLHPLVECDNCSCEVRGFRYKCLTCPNMDLCSECERQGKHAQHNMIRISSINKDSAETHHQLFLVRNQFLTRTIATVKSGNNSSKSHVKKEDRVILTPRSKLENKPESANSKIDGFGHAITERIQGVVYRSAKRAHEQSQVDDKHLIDDLNIDSTTSSFSSVSSSITSIDSISSPMTPAIQPNLSERDDGWSFVHDNLYYVQDFKEDDATLSHSSSESFEQVDVDES